MDQEILKVFFYDVRCAVVRHFSAWSAEGTSQNRHWTHHRCHATDSLERTRLSCWCL